MRRKSIYCFVTFLLVLQMLLSDLPVCRAAETGSGASPLRESGSKITSVSISPGTAVVSKNDSCTFTASVSGENDYSRDVAWSVSGQKSRNTFIDGNGVLNVASDETASSLIVRAVSKQDSRYSATALAAVQKSSYSIQVKASPDNGGTVQGSGTVEEGGYMVISAAPNNGFTFEGWSLDNNIVSNDSRYIADNIRSDRTYVAVFHPVSCQVNVTVSDSNAGTATESRTVAYGENMTLEAWSKEGYQFDSWMENGNIIGTDRTLTLNNITASRNITAVFTHQKYSLLLAAYPANTGTVSGQGSYEQGSNVRIKAQPNSGYRFVSWSDNGNVISTSEEYSVNNLSKDMFLVATFEREQAKSYTITASSDSSGGAVMPEGKSTVTEGGGILYTIVPADGYRIHTVYVDGTSVGTVSSYSFTDVRGDHTISADFKALPIRDTGSTGSADSKPSASNPTESKPSESKPADPDSTSAPDSSGEDGKTSQTDKDGSLTGTLRRLDISVEKAKQLIDDGDDRELMLGALQTGDLRVTIHNDFADTTQETASDNFYENSGVPNFGTALDYILNKEEKIELLLGNRPVTVNFRIGRIAPGEASSQTVKRFEENKVGGMQIGQYFGISLMKSTDGDTRMITELPSPLKVVIEVPEHLKADGRRFYILRLHTNEDDSTDYAELADEDKDPDTVTFSTDRFSPYAIGYLDLQANGAESGKSAKSGKGDIIISVIVVIAVMLAAAATFLLMRRSLRRQ